MTMTASRAHRRLRTLAAGAIAVALVTGIFDAHYRFFDMVIYHDAIRWWLTGGELYEYAAPVRGHLGFTYPPFAALVLMPVAALPAQLAGWLNAAGSIVALGVVLTVVCTPIAARHGWSRRAVVLVAVPLGLCMEPIRQTIGLGQVNLWLFALVTLDVVGRPGRTGSRWAGMGIGIAAAVKVTPALFIVYLLVTGQWRAARTAAGTAAGLTLAAVALAPAESTRFFGSLLWQTDRVGATDSIANQSLAGLLARTGGTPGAPTGWWPALALVALVAGLYRARLARAGGDQIAALTLVGLTANLISPMSWTHHLVFLPVALVILIDVADRERKPLPAVAALGTWGLSVVSPIWFAEPGAGPLWSDTFTLLLIALVVGLPWRATVRGPEAASSATAVTLIAVEPGSDSGLSPQRNRR